MVILVHYRTQFIPFSRPNNNLFLFCDENRLNQPCTLPTKPKVTQTWAILLLDFLLEWFIQDAFRSQRLLCLQTNNMSFKAEPFNSSNFT